MSQWLLCLIEREGCLERERKRKVKRERDTHFLPRLEKHDGSGGELAASEGSGD